MVKYVPLKIFFVNKLSTHPGKYIMVVCHLQKDSGNFCWKVNAARLFGSFQRTISGSNETSEKVVLCSRREYIRQKFVFHFFKATFDTSFRPSQSFSYKWNWFVQMVNTIPGRNLPVLNFAYHLPKPWSDWFAHQGMVNNLQHIFYSLLGFCFVSGCFVRSWSKFFNLYLFGVSQPLMNLSFLELN